MRPALILYVRTVDPVTVTRLEQIIADATDSAARAGYTVVEVHTDLGVLIDEPLPGYLAATAAVADGRAVLVTITEWAHAPESDEARRETAVRDSPGLCPGCGWPPLHITLTRDRDGTIERRARCTRCTRPEPLACPRCLGTNLEITSREHDGGTTTRAKCRDCAPAVEEEALRRAAAGDLAATAPAATIHAERGELDAALALVPQLDAFKEADQRAARRVAEALTHHGAIDEAIGVLRRQVYADYHAAEQLAELLAARGEILAAFREVNAHDDIKPRRVAEKMARWLAAGVDTASLAELRRLVEDGTIPARPWLVELLRDRDPRGRNDDGTPGERR